MAEEQLREMAERIDSHVGNRIRLKRAELGMTQGDLARALSLTPQQVQKYETGANRISASRLYEISEHLHVQMDFFFETFENGELKKLSNRPDRVLNGLVKDFRGIENQSRRNAIAGLVRSIRESKAGRQ